MVNLDQHTEDLVELQGRLVLIKVGLLIVLALLGLRIWQLQVRDGDYYQDLAMQNRTRSIILEPARGLLYDRHGALLAKNVPSFTLYVSRQDVSDQAALIEQLHRYLGLDAAEVHRKLRNRGPAARVKIKDGLSLREAAVIESHRLDLPGVIIQPEYQRHYPFERFAAHLIGYVGEISEAQLQQPAYQDLNQGSIVGQYGIERTYDPLLRGQPGRELIEVDALGHKTRSISVDPPLAGHDLYLTIDIRLQKLAEELLGEEAGAIVALDPRNGDVLALASRPGFDPNMLSREMTPSQWQQITQDPRHPLTNRAIQGQYPPGSTFKIVVGAAALDTHAVEVGEHLQCAGGYRFGKRTYRDWKAGGHGSIDFVNAIADSCDVYFYRVGYRLGIETIAAYATQFGLGQSTGIDLPAERPGLVPTPDWKRKTRGEPWYPGETISVAIGQGFVTVTPIQMAQVIATVANNGLRMRPRLVRAVRDRQRDIIEERPPVVQKQLPVSQATLRHLRRALRAVVTEGTATQANSPLVPIAGKTGTAQVVALKFGSSKGTPKSFRDHAWFVAYAPDTQPRIAVSVLVEHMGHGGSSAAPLARQLIEAAQQWESDGFAIPLTHLVADNSEEDHD
ncbi:MAG: penicillin-binding protein 2 [Nitrospirae bacterium]|nr:MAG: penicillin-binding protein 2 [Nitrospirota bacterium]